MTTTYNEGTASSLVTTKQEVQPYGLSQIVVDVPEFKVTGSEFWYTTSNGTSYNATYTEPAENIRPINRHNTATGRARVESSGNLVYGARHRNENYDEFGASTADTRTLVQGATYIIPGPVTGTRPRFPIPYFPADSVGKTIVVEGQRRTILKVNNLSTDADGNPRLVRLNTITITANGGTPANGTYVSSVIQPSSTQGSGSGISVTLTLVQTATQTIIPNVITPGQNYDPETTLQFSEASIIQAFTGALNNVGVTGAPLILRFETAYDPYITINKPFDPPITVFKEQPALQPNEETKEQSAWIALNELTSEPLTEIQTLTQGINQGGGQVRPTAIYHNTITGETQRTPPDDFQVHSKNTIPQLAKEAPTYLIQERRRTAFNSLMIGGTIDFQGKGMRNIVSVGGNTSRTAGITDANTLTTDFGYYPDNPPGSTYLIRYNAS